MTVPGACRKTTFCDTKTDSCARASCPKAPLFDTRESIGEKSVAHVPGFFGFLLNRASPEKSYRLLQQSEGAVSYDSPCFFHSIKKGLLQMQSPFLCVCHASCLSFMNNRKNR